MFLHKLTDSNFKNVNVTYIPNPSRYSSRGILLNDQKQIAMLYMSSNGYYKLPGGGVEKSETNEDAFLREIKEETGFDCKILYYLGVVEEHKNKNNFMQLSSCYVAKVIGQPRDVTLTEAEKELGFQLTWMDYHQAVEIMNKSIQECTDYIISFMLLRDSTILNEGWKIISQPPETPLMF
ncbi:MAG: hydrolase [Clostridiales bacterium]|jgi:8-oxo-dGTP diphosphatase|nr:hydrolase [Clostridiales bacterium]